MRIFYQVSTGNVIGTVDGFDDDHTAGMFIQPADVDASDIDQHVIRLGDPDEPIARRLMDGRDHLTIAGLKHNGKGLTILDKQPPRNTHGNNPKQTP